MRRTIRGFTMVEMIVALAIASCVLCAMMGLLRWAVFSYYRSEDRLAPRERAAFALLTLRTAIADAWQYGAAPGGVAFHGPRKDGEVRQEGDKLRYRAPGETRMIDLISHDVVEFRVTALRPGLLQLELTLARARRDGRAQAPLTVTDEVFVPAIGLREAGPWTRVPEHRKALEPSV